VCVCIYIYIYKSSIWESLVSASNSAVQVRVDIFSYTCSQETTTENRHGIMHTFTSRKLSKNLQLKDERERERERDANM
jgi:hypothetical protein